MLISIFAQKSLLLIKRAFVVLAIMPLVAAAQYDGNPVPQDKLEKTLRNKQFPTGQLVDTIRKKGVDFQLTPEIERRLVSAGARPELLEAIRQHYRKDLAPAPASAGAAGSAPNAPATPAANQKNFTGAPLTKDAVIALLQNGVADAQVQKNIAGRGVSFQMNPDIAKELKSHGGSDALVGTIFAAYVAPANPEPSPNTGGTIAPSNTAKTAADAYEELLERANDSYNSATERDSPEVLKSIKILQQAVALDANNPRAYQGLGYQNLYGSSANNFGVVEGFFNKAIGLGGNAVVRVYHDHNGTFYDICEGTLYITKDAVRFESDNNVHTFETTKDNIQQVKLNNAFKQMYQEKKGSYKIVLKSEDAKGTKFSFAPLTQNLEESKMVVRLVGKN